ncbi:MAG TPA: ATP-binding protein, partial [Caulobacteraceae bacterium]|nr:ATP-binding protein [Caulobacteraceae bacterium]
ARRYRETNERQLTGAARTLALALDGEIGKADTLLRTLASSAAMQEGDFHALDHEARAVLTDPSMWIVVQDENGRSLVNTFSQLDRPLGRGDPANFKPRWEALQRTGRFVSPLVRGSRSGEQVVGLSLLAHDSAGRAYNMAIVIRPEVMSRLLGRQGLPKGWYSGVLDQNGVIIARNIDGERYLGRSAKPDMLQAMRDRPSGVREAVALDGSKMLTAFDRSPLTGWTVSVGMPRSEATGYLSRSLRLLALGSFALLLVGGLLSFMLARGTSRAVEKVVDAARQLGAGQAVFIASSGTGMMETDQILEAVATASSELRAREQQLKTLNETLEARVEETAGKLVQAQKIDTLGQLTGGVAHDFNNLLSPIIGGLDRLQRGGLSEERAQRAISGALESAERAKTLVQRLLAFARRQPLQPIAVDLVRTMTGLKELISSTMGPRVEVVIDVPSGLPAATADPNQLELAILNLVVNARDAMPEGGILSIVARTAVDGAPDHLPPGDYVELRIADTGAGMSADVLACAVEPFFSTKGVGRGTGLGLSMVHGLAAQLGGALKLQSEPGRGTVVELWLPASKTAAPSPDASTFEPAAPPTGGVLLVEDDVLVRASTAAMLSDLGYTVVECGSAAEAIVLLEGGVAIDLMVSDHLMPGMTGAELARTVAKRWPAIGALIISGYANVDEIAPDLPRLIKPFRQADLAAALTAVVRLQASSVGDGAAR